MPKQITLDYIQRLRTTKTRQCTGLLREIIDGIPNGKLCALGVGAEMLIERGGFKWQDKTHLLRTNDNTIMYYEYLQDYLGVPLSFSIIMLNDTYHYTFTQIADKLEEHIAAHPELYPNDDLDLHHARPR